LSDGPVVVLAGGTGGAKLARGMLDVVGDDLVVVANTADDVEVHGAYVSPDPDLVTYWLADRIDPRGWGVADDTFAVMDALRALGEDVWFSLGDLDLAACLRRKERLEAGWRLTDAAAELARSLGVTARVLPASDDPVRTWVLARGEWVAFQEFMIRQHAAGPVDGVEFRGAEAASATPEVVEAIARARAIVIGPSNPIISIAPIFAVGGVRDAIRDARAPVVAVSPVVGGAVVKGPTEPFMQWAGHSLDADGIAQAYAGLLDGLVTDEDGFAGSDVPTGRHGELALLTTDTLMPNSDHRARVAKETLRFAESLAQ
jgi:LPPG:FO 2-phospho-L-lactate transferase